MADETEELEPLFDYSRVQPNIVCLDDDDDVVAVTKKRKKNSHSQHVVENGKKTNVKAVNVVDLEDDDWLPSPPKVSGKVHKEIDEEDSTLKNLRLIPS